MLSTEDKKQLRPVLAAIIAHGFASNHHALACMGNTATKYNIATFQVFAREVVDYTDELLKELEK